jgi:hypothetical protein
MTETVTVGVTSSVFNEDTGKYADELTVHYSGPARIKYPSMVVSEKTPVGQVLASQDVILSLPVEGSSAVQVNDTVWVDASEVDADLADTTFRIKGNPQRGAVTAHRYPVETK